MHSATSYDAFVQQRLAARGLTLPAPPKPLGRYTAVSQAGDLLFISGQLPLADGKIVWQGQIGTELSPEEGRRAAEMAALNVLSQIHAYLGGFERLDHLVRLEGQVAMPGRSHRLLDWRPTRRLFWW